MPRGGSAPGERRGGRQLGTPNKNTAQIKAVASKYGPAIIDKLAEMAGVIPSSIPAESETARIAAMRELLDRGYGKATQPLSGDAEGPPLAIEFTWAPAITQPTPARAAVEKDATSGFVVAFATETC
jgi:hypothetical protein